MHVSELDGFATGDGQAIRDSFLATADGSRFKSELTRLQTEATDGFLGSTGDDQARYAHAALVISNVMSYFASKDEDAEMKLATAVGERAAADVLKDTLSTVADQALLANLKASLAGWEQSPQAKSAELADATKKLGQAHLAKAPTSGGCALLLLIVVVGVALQTVTP